MKYCTMKYGKSLLVACALLLAAAARADEPQGSLYDLKLQFTDQGGHKQPLAVFRGHPVWVIMFYSSCPNACPLLIESLRANENGLTQDVRQDLRVLLVSIDPDRDTPSTLNKLAASRHIDTARWMLASASADDVRSIAAALGVQYRRLPNGEFNHTSVITLLQRDGEIGKQTSILGRADPALTAATGAASVRAH
jgi:protein SCO1/2